MVVASHAKFQIFILTYNRPNELRETVMSWLTQDLTDTQLIVSDNSTVETTAEMMRAQFPQVELRRRKPSLSSTDHFNTVRSEATAPWFMMFHDDDLMAPQGFAAYRNAVAAHPDVVAIAGNSRFLRGDRVTDELFNADIPLDRMIASARELALGYFSPVGALQPFPAYLYNTEKIAGLTFDARKARKYSDMIFLTEVAECGAVLWLASPLMITRAHAGSDSATHDIRAAILIRRRMIARSIFRPNDPELELYRMWSYLLHLRRIGLLRRPWQARGKSLIILSQTIRYFLTHPQPILRKIWSRFPR